MCSECEPAISSETNIVFTYCKYCNQLNDHVETPTGEGLCLTCKTCGTIMFPDETQDVLHNIQQHRRMLGLQ